MRCKNVERLIIEATERKLNDREKNTIEEHVSRCAACASFHESCKEIHSAVNNIPVPSLDPEVEERTRMVCQKELRSKRVFDRSRYPRFRRSHIPGLVWGALITLTVMTIFVVAPQVKDLRLDQSMTFANIVGLSLVLQNAVMLILTPLIMRKFHQKNQGLNPV